LRVNRLFTREPWLGVPADFWYASLHYVVTPAVLIWLFRARAEHYRAARTWLLISTFIGLIGFTLMPTAPPRLLPGGDGFIDTMAKYGSYGWWGSDASAPRGMGHLTNQYAAMPSLHVGWSLWCGIMLFRFGRHWTLRALGVIYPVMTALVVMGTANHYLMDAAAGVLVMGIGFVLGAPALRVVDSLYARLGREHAQPAADKTVPATAASTVSSSAVFSSADAPSASHASLSFPDFSEGAPSRPATTAPDGGGIIAAVPRPASPPPGENDPAPGSGATVPGGEPAGRS